MLSRCAGAAALALTGDFDRSICFFFPAQPDDAYTKISSCCNCPWQVLRKRGQGIGILVSKCPKETNASYSLQDPSEVMDFLLRLVEWKRKSPPPPMIRPRV